MADHSSWLRRHMHITRHTASFWNIIIQMTSHDDLTETKNRQWNDDDDIFFSVKWQKLKLHFVIWQKNCLCLTDIEQPNLQIILEAKSMDESSWKKNLLYQFLL